MFIKGNKENEIETVSKVPGPPSLISSDLEFTGDIKSLGEVQIDGIINGDIVATALVIGETAKINGEITADTVRIHGHVKGQIKANTVSLAKTANILGDILHSNLAIEEGAYLEGHCRRIEESKKSDEGSIKFLVKGVSKNKSDQTSKKLVAEKT